jgi:transcriptional regulator with GAF, ATPase, and Fis domain
MPSALIGQSAALRELKEEITRVAHSDAKVLITGESGTGKERFISRAPATIAPSFRSIAPG